MSGGQPIRILIMDDDAGQARLAQRTLERAGYGVEVAGDGDTGLALHATRAYDVLLVDHQMPSLGGLDVLRRLATQGAPPPTIMVTGHGDEAVAVEAMKLGAGDYVVKDVEGRYLTLLPTVVARVLHQQRLRAEQRQAEERLRQEAALLDLTHDTIIVRNMEERIVFWNRGAEERYGWTKAEALGHNPHTLLRTEFPQPLAEIQADFLRQGRWEGELVHTTRAGTRVVMASRWALQRNAAGQPVAMLEINNDITERKRLEDQLRQAQKMEAIGTLAGGIAHDFNNILAAILGFTELAASDVPPVSAAGCCLQEVLTACKRARDLVQQILAFSRKTMTERKPLALHVLLKEALTLLRASLPSTIQIRAHISDEAGAVLADATQMHQVLMNLCANAEYAMRDTGGILEVRLEAVDVDAVLAAAHPDLRPGPYVRLTVRDTGHGMTPEVLEHIFEPYFTTKPQGESTGMGLAVVHGIVLSHGGALAVTSAPELGTTFTIYLPRLAEAAPDHPAPAEEPLPGGTERLLFVDDEPAIAALGQAVLTRLGYQVVVCSSGAEALATFGTASPPFDLVITDQTMPQMTGDALARALWALRPDLPIILCTGFSHTMDAERARAAGMDALLMKPWQSRELAHTIRRVLAQRTYPQPACERPPTNDECRRTRVSGMADFCTIE